MPEECRAEPPNEPKKFYQWIEYVNYDWKRDSAGELRNVLLVVAVLFVTVAFQAGVNLPSHIFPAQDGSGSSNSTGNTYAQAVFLASNTVLLSASTHVIHYLTGSLPFRQEMMAASWSLTATYGCSIGATSLHASIKIPILFIPLGFWALRWAPCFRPSKRENSTSSRLDQQSSPDQQNQPDQSSSPSNRPDQPSP